MERPDAHLTMLRHVIEKRRPAVGILSIRDKVGARPAFAATEGRAGVASTA